MSKIFFLFLNFKFARLFCFFADLGHGIIEQTTGSLYFWAAHLAGPSGGHLHHDVVLGSRPSELFLELPLRLISQHTFNIFPE